MKGTFFSADFVVDKNDEYRLIEINTDTGIVQSQAYIFDWTEFIGVLNTNNITDVEVVYKYDIQNPIVTNLSASLAENAPFVTSFTKTVVAADSIFPTAPTDGDNKFILRMAYDESAILDSEYAKGILNLLTLFANAGDSGSVCNFYHSSSLHGEYDTLDRTQFNGSLLPDMVSKPLSETHREHSFYKIGHSESGSLERYAAFLKNMENDNIVLEQYHINQSQIDAGVVKSIRSFCIVYGSNLDLCYAAEYEIESVLSLPTGSIVFDDSVINNKLQTKHYYEYATNTVKNVNHGILENEDILDINNQSVLIKDMVLGNSYLSYFISGSPNTDDYEVLREWNYEGTSLPSGSYLTSSVLIGLYEDTTYANDLTEIKFESGDAVIIGGEARMLVRNDTTGIVSYQRVVDLTTDYSVFGMNDTTNSITELNLVIYDEQQPVYTMNMEDVDNFILASGNFVSFFVVHNLVGGSCFIAGTKVLMGDDSEKNIEDVVVGDIVLSFNETTLQNEPKEVTALRQPVHSTMVKYHFGNGGDVSCTYDHPIYVADYEIASITPSVTNDRYNIPDKITRQIAVGDIVHLPTGDTSTIDTIEDLPMMDYQTYLITVADNHNFYANNILVHNK